MERESIEIGSNTWSWIRDLVRSLKVSPGEVVHRAVWAYRELLKYADSKGVVTLLLPNGEEFRFRTKP